MELELDTAPNFAEVEAKLLHHLSTLFGLNLEEIPTPTFP
jgi:hypothetical protein